MLAHLAYGARVRTALRAATRYVAYTSDVGEAFRPVVPPWVVTRYDRIFLGGTHYNGGDLLQWLCNLLAIPGRVCVFGVVILRLPSDFLPIYYH